MTARIECSYTTYLGHDPARDLDLMFTVWADGGAELATRPGRGETWTRWSPPVQLAAERMPEGMVGRP